MHFVEFATPSKWGSFGAVENYGARKAPKWEALRDFSLSKTCWWDGCADKKSRRPLEGVSREGGASSSL